MIGTNSLNESFTGFGDSSNEELKNKMKLLEKEIKETKRRIESYGFGEEDYYPELNLQIEPSRKSTQKIDSNQKVEYHSRRCRQSSLTHKTNILQEIDGNENYTRAPSSLAINENQAFGTHIKSFGEAPTLETPGWTCKPLSPSTDREGTEDLDNEVFAKRHEGPELQEQKIKRKYAKEVCKIEKYRRLKEAYEKRTTKWSFQ